MKLKKIIALACSLVMLASTAIVANAAVDGATATLEFAGYETKGATTFAVINVNATIPDTLVPYEMIPADWETTFEDSYKGKMIQSVGFDIPNVAGLTYVGSLSSAASYVQLQENKADGKIQVYAANTGAFDTYYAGAVDKLATLYYRITGDVNGTYNVSLTNAVIGLVDIAADGTVTPKEYTFNDFTVTNAVVEPVVEEDPVVTINAGANVVYTASATGAVAKGTEVTVTAKPKAGYVLDSADFDAMGGTYTFTVEADTEITINAVEVTAAPAIVATAFVEDFGASNCVTFFGKAPATAAEYGIDFGDDTFYNEAQDKTYGPKFAAKSMSAAGFFGVKIHNLPAGDYSVSAYADAANSAAYAFAK